MVISALPLLGLKDELHVHSEKRRDEGINLPFKGFYIVYKVLETLMTYDLY